MEYSVNIGKIFRKLYRMLWLIALVTAVAFAAGFAYTWTAMPDMYRSTVTLVGAANGSYSNSVGNVYIMRNYSGLVKSEKVAEIVVQALPQYHLNTFYVQSMVQVSYDQTTNTTMDSALLYIKADSTDPDISMAVANAAANAFVTQLKAVSGADIAIIVDKASSSQVSFSGKEYQTRTRLEFAAGGLLLSCLFLSVTELLNKRVREVRDCTLGGTINLLGVIPKYNID